MGARRSIPISVHLLTAGLAAAAIATAAATGARNPATPGWVLVPLALTLVISGVIQLDVHFLKGDKNAIDLFEAAVLPVLAVSAGPGAVALVAVTKLLSQRLRRVPWPKLAFNVAQWSLATALAGLAYVHLEATALGSLMSLAVAMVVIVVVNHVAVAGVFALVQRRSYPSVLVEFTRASAPGIAIADSVNVSFGLMFAAGAMARPEVSFLFPGPLLVLGWAHRAYTEVALDRARLDALQRATHHLSGDIAPATVLPEVLGIVQSAFSSASVAALLGDGVRVHAGDDLGELAVELAASAPAAGAVRVTAGDGSRAGEVLAREGHRCALVAPLAVEGRVLGALVSIDRTGADGFDDGELAVFDALAAEVASALARGGLHAALERERAHLFDIVDRSSDGIFTVSAEGTIVDWNPAMDVITEFTAAEARGAAVQPLLRARTPAGEPVAIESWTELDPGELPQEIEVLTRAGEPRVLACSFASTLSDPPALVVTARDVTRQRELDRLRDDFVAAVSHELRTPLTSIVGFSTMLVEPPRPLTAAEHDEAVEMIRRGARRLERLVFNLLEVARIENRPTPASRPFDITRACEAAIAEVREAYPHREIVLGRGSGAVRAVGNQLSVEQILANLLGNALKYADRGPIEVTIHEQPETVVVSVTDHGPGIPAPEQERIFDRFHRMDQHHVQAGTGLGLYISRQLAVSMGGSLSVTSAPGEGATFSLSLPAQVHLVAVG